MNTVPEKSNICLLFKDNDQVDRAAYKHSLVTFKHHDSELFEAESDFQGLNLASVLQPDRVRVERPLPEIKDTGFLTKPSEAAGKMKMPAVLQTEMDAASSLAINQLIADTSLSNNTAGGESSAKAFCEPREQQMLREKTEALEQLRKAEAKYRNLVEQIPVITYIASLETPLKLLYLSPQISQLGFPEQDWLDDSKGLLKRVHPDDLAVTMEAYDHTYEHHVPLRCEYRLSKNDGNYRWFLDEANVVRNEAGESLFLQGVLVDITKDKETERELSYYRQRLEEMVGKRTEQLEKQCMILKSANASLDTALVELKRANSEVRNNERRFRLLLDAAGEGIVGLDTNGRCSFVNRAALAMSGYTAYSSEICRPFHGKAAT